MPSKPTTIWLDEEDRELAEVRKKENGQKSLSALIRFWLRISPKRK